MCVTATRLQLCFGWMVFINILIIILLSCVSGKTFSATLFKRLFGLGKAEGLGRKSNILMYSG